MPITAPLRNRITNLKKEYEKLKKGKESLLVMIDEVEIPESVYNSNAIENSTLTLKETERILLEMAVSRDVSVREIYEAKNLSRVMEYVRGKSLNKNLDIKTLLLLHEMLIGGIDDEIAGRFRAKGEFVRVGTHIAPHPEYLNKMIESFLDDFMSDISSFPTDKIAKFHLDFEKAHPFNDGNGRIGRVIINYQLQRINIPVIIIRDKDKKNYYEAFNKYNDLKDTKLMEKVIALAVIESLHKRIAYLRGEEIITVTEYAKKNNKTAPAMLNAARRQNIPAFHEKGVWKIGIDL